MQKSRKQKRKRNDKNTNSTECIDQMIRYTNRKDKYKQLNKELKKLNNMIGMDELKNAVVSQIQFIMTNKGDLDDHFLNTCLMGPPGSGKTSVAEILYNIWMSMGIFDAETPFTILHRADFVGTYMGHTANKTKKLLQKHSGGVLFIDEAYALMNGEKDDYGREAIDTLNGFLSEEKGKTIVIIAGYKDELDDQFFGANSGLRRRFGWNFTIRKYSAHELYSIFVSQLHKHGWTCSNEVKKLFVDNYEKFVMGGGDTENICFKAKLQYSKKNWWKQKQSKKLSLEHVKEAMEAHFVNKECEISHNMYI
jgi:SpoVK/Ycf46/Vps4 family AAA+-type ATPase